MNIVVSCGAMWGISETFVGNEQDNNNYSNYLHLLGKRACGVTWMPVLSTYGKSNELGKQRPWRLSLRYRLLSSSSLLLWGDLPCWLRLGWLNQVYVYLSSSLCMFETMSVHTCIRAFSSLQPTHSQW